MRVAFIAAALAAACGGVCAQAAPTATDVHYRIVDRIPGRDGAWDFASIDPAGNALYIARGDAIERVDLATHKVVDSLAPARRAHSVLALDSGEMVFETDGETGLARFVSVKNGAVLAEVATGAKPDAAFVDPATGLIAVMNAGDGTVALIDPRTRTLAGKITVGGSLEFGVTDGEGGAFVNIEDANAIARIDLKSKRRTGTIALPGCDGPTGLALVANGARLISACANHVALVIDAKSGKTLATLAIGADPDAVLVDETRGLAFIPCGGSGTLVALSIVDPHHIAVAGIIPTQRGAKTGALDPRDGRIYLPAATLEPVAKGSKRGQPVSGSFTVLVLAPAKKGDKALQYLNQADFVPTRTLPAPPPKGSAAEALELARIHALINGADAARIAQAKADSDREDPSIFDTAARRDLRALPNTWALLTLVQSETDLAIGSSKDFFNRTRPWGVDTTIHNCENEPGAKPMRGYPSGHSGLGYSVGWTLAQLLPDRAPAILDRARDYAVSREICGAHFASDTEASHVVGTLAAWKLANDPRLSGLYEAAREELATSANR
ncbi:phosphatase PAP2 family protein [Sphingomonas sp. NFR15]|uniref:phosphatase PAP2 family protein n=1 Tax=Sphingomonas sp. NFR15 TaxID=1566282 RepID=UPI000B8553EE|nr:phosphatase PAP2 family protein [Sphingomonas sp. NFR15]